jgi:RHS repeat-associated protein
VSSNTNGASLAYTYDVLNRLSTVCDNRIAPNCGAAGKTTYGYDFVGNLSSYVYPNAVQTGNVFDTQNRLTQTCDATSSPACSASQKLASYTYTLGNAGNRTNVVELSGRSLVYGYDNDYRLTSEAITGDPAGNNGTVSYTGYDAVGNRTLMTSTLNAVPGGSFFYDANDRLTTDIYDANGNTTSSAGISNGYDFENRMLTHGAVTLVYDGDGNHVSETVGGTTTKFLVDDHNQTGLSQVLDELVNGSVTRTYAYGLDRIGENQLVNNTWTPSFYGYDGHGNVRFLANSGASVTDSYDYDAFGMPIRTSGTTPNSFLYSGERSDGSIGLYDLRARYYNQATGRFWARDPYEGASCSPLSYNPYIYAWDDPADRTDPTGRLTAEDVEIRKLPWTTVAGQTAVAAAIICGLVKVGSGVVVAAANAGHPFTLEDAGPCLFKASRIFPSDCPPDQREPTPSNPGSTPFGPIRGSPCKINLDTGEIWCYDKSGHAGPHWEVYKNRRDWERGDRDRAVWDNGCLK